MDEAVKDLSEFAEVNVESPMGIVCLVGEGIKRTVGVPGRIFGVLAEEGIGVRMISMGAGGTNISLLLKEEDVGPSVGSLHKICFEG